MFKFGKKYVKYSEPERLYMTGTTMNYLIGVDPAVIDEFVPTITSRYATNVVNPNYYGMITHKTRWEDEL